MKKCLAVCEQMWSRWCWAMHPSIIPGAEVSAPPCAAMCMAAAAGCRRPDRHPVQLNAVAHYR